MNVKLQLLFCELFPFVASEMAWMNTAVLGNGRYILEMSIILSTACTYGGGFESYQLSFIVASCVSGKGSKT